MTLKAMIHPATDASQGSYVIGVNGMKLVYTVQEAGALLGLSRGSAYEAARRGELPTLRIGRRLVVPIRALEKILEGAGEAS